MRENTILAGLNKDGIHEVYKIFFGTLISRSRLDIINLLDGGEKNVSTIAKSLNQDQTTVSHNLRKLRSCGFVDVRVQGRYRFYKLNKKTIEPLIRIINNHMSTHCIHLLDTNYNNGGKKKK